MGGSPRSNKASLKFRLQQALNNIQNSQTSVYTDQTTTQHSIIRAPQNSANGSLINVAENVSSYSNSLNDRACRLKEKMESMSINIE